MTRRTTEKRRDPRRWRWLAGLLLAALLLGGCAEASTGPTGGAGSAPNGSEPTATAPAASAPAKSAGSAPVEPAPATPAVATVSGGRQTPSGATPATAARARASVTITPGATTPEEPAVTSSSHGGGGGGGNNVVRLVNRHDGRMRIRGNIDLNRIPGDRVEPINLAYAYSSCTDCQTIAVALQINLISRTASYIAPQNAAIAINEECLRCITYAGAIQYTYQVDDPKDTPKEVSRLIREMDRTLNEIARDRGISLAEAASRIDAVIADFNELAASLNDQRDQDTADNRSGTPTPSGTPATTRTPATPRTATPTTTATPAASPAAPSPPGSTPTPSPAVAPSPTVTPTRERTPTTAAGPTPTATP